MSCQRRQTTREIGAKALDLQTLSNLLWAAFGINVGRPMGSPPAAIAAALVSRMRTAAQAAGASCRRSVTVQGLVI